MSRGSYEEAAQFTQGLLEFIDETPFDERWYETLTYLKFCDLPPGDWEERVVRGISILDERRKYVEERKELNEFDPDLTRRVVARSVNKTFGPVFRKDSDLQGLDFHYGIISPCLVLSPHLFRRIRKPPVTGVISEFLVDDLESGIPIPIVMRQSSKVQTRSALIHEQVHAWQFLIDPEIMETYFLTNFLIENEACLAYSNQIPPTMDHLDSTEALIEQIVRASSRDIRIELVASLMEGILRQGKFASTQLREDVEVAVGSAMETAEYVLYGLDYEDEFKFLKIIDFQLKLIQPIHENMEMINLLLDGFEDEGLKSKNDKKKVGFRLLMLPIDRLTPKMVRALYYPHLELDPVAIDISKTVAQSTTILAAHKVSGLRSVIVNRLNEGEQKKYIRELVSLFQSGFIFETLEKGGYIEPEYTVEKLGESILRYSRLYISSKNKRLLKKMLKEIGL